jgi:hypothetical protein
MKYLKKFENFEAEEMELKPTAYDMALDAQEDEYQDEYAQDEEEEESWIEEEENKPEEEVEEVTLEKKKLPAGLKAYLDKKKKGAESKSTAKGKAKPDFLDLDKDGDKKEPMKKAAKEAKAKKR